MNQIRAIIDGKEVFGWYYYSSLHEKHYVVSECSAIHPFKKLVRMVGYNLGILFIEILDLSLCSVATGRKDKHGVEIYGSMGDMKGGYLVTEYGRDYYFVTWDVPRCGWHLRDATNGQNHGRDKPLYDAQQLKICPRNPK